MRSYFLMLAMAMPLLAVRLESTRLAPSVSVWFEPNAGQVKGRTEFVGRTRGAFLYMTGREVVYALAPAKIEPGAKMRQVRMEFAGAALASAGAGEGATGGYSNYFVGKAEKEWFTGVSHYGRLRYREVYPGIDVVYYGADGAIEFDFIAKPGADVSKIGMRFHGATSVDVDEDVFVKKDGAEMRVRRPRVFQGGIEIPSWYEREDDVVKVRMAEVDSTAALTIDPILDFSTYLGGPGEDSIQNLAMSADGNLVLAGSTQSPASPTLDPFQQPSVVSAAPIILKMSADGKRILFYTILGRNGWDWASALAIAKDGSIVLGGSTRSASFPLKNAFQTEFKAIWDNCWVARLTGDGRSLIYSSYMGGSNREAMYGVTLDDVGNAYFGGQTASNDYPIKGAIQSRFSGAIDGFLTSITPDGNIRFSTYLGGGAIDTFRDLKWRKDGVVVLVGMTTSDDFPLKNPIQMTGSPRGGMGSAYLVLITDDGSSLIYSSYIGGTSFGDVGAVALDQSGRIYVGASAGDRGFPVKNPLFSEAEGFHGALTIFDPSAKERIYSTLIPGLWIQAMELAEDGSIYLGGSATSSDIPLKDSLQSYIGGGIGRSDGFLMKLSPDGRVLLFSTVLGGGNIEFQGGIVLAPNKVIYAAGQTASLDFPVRSAYQTQSGGSTDGFLYRITDNSVLPPTSSLNVSPARMTFRYVKGDELPPASPITISGLTGQIFATLSVPWLKATPMGLGVSGTISVTVDPSALSPGVHQGALRLSPSTGEAVVIEVTVSILAAPPLLSAVEPATVPIGTDDTEITLRGTGFTNRTTVQLQTNLWQLTPLRFIDSTTLKLTIPKAYFSAEFNHSITVQNPDSAVSKPVSLAVGRPAPSIAAKGIVSAASYAGEVISPGEILTLFGENFEQGMRVNFDGLLATPLYITPGQLSVVAPTGLAGAREVNVIVEMNFDWRSIPVRMPVWPARPGLFTANSSGKGQAAALNQDGSVTSPANPAAKGSIAVLYGTGGGVENLTTKVFIDGIECEVLYAGQAPGLVAGAWQLNVRIPEFASKGEVVWRAGERESVEGVFVALKEN